MLLARHGPGHSLGGPEKQTTKKNPGRVDGRRSRPSFRGSKKALICVLIGLSTVCVVQWFLKHLCRPWQTLGRLIRWEDQIVLAKKWLVSVLYLSPMMLLFLLVTMAAISIAAPGLGVVTQFSPHASLGDPQSRW